MRPTSCAGVTPVVAPGCGLPSFGSAVQIWNPWSSLQRSHRLRESKDCACRGLECFLQLLRKVQKDAEAPDSCSGAATPRAKSAIATSDHGLCFSREVQYKDDVKRQDADHASFEKCGAGPVQKASCGLRFLREAGDRDCAERQRTAQVSSGRLRTKAEQRWQPATPNAELHPPGCWPAQQLRCGG